MKRRLLLLPLAMVASLVWSVGAQAETLLNEQVPITLTFPNPCSPTSGETITITGTEHVDVHTIVGQDGALHLQVEDNLDNVTGLSSTGVSYTVVGFDQFHLNIRPTETTIPGNETQIDVLRLIGIGGQPTISVTLRHHGTENANGTVTADFFVMDVSCDG
jgi:hypothetical protein